jgi:hypothetical protein
VYKEESNADEDASEKSQKENGDEGHQETGQVFG